MDTNFNSIFQRHQDLLKEEKQILEEMEKNFEGGLAEYLRNEIPELDTFVIVGYTPGFNDGDPCTHSSDYFLAGGIYSEEYWCAVDGDYDDQDEDEENLKLNENLNTEELKNKAHGILQGIEQLCEKLYVTNYKVLYKDGEVTVDKEYDCGY